jgi:hypothetical protein
MCVWACNIDVTLSQHGQQCIIDCAKVPQGMADSFIQAMWQAMAVLFLVACILCSLAMLVLD